MDSEDSFGFGFAPEGQVANTAVPPQNNITPPPLPPPTAPTYANQGLNPDNPFNNNAPQMTAQVPPNQMNMANNPNVANNMDDPAFTAKDIDNTVQTAQEAKSKCRRCISKCTSAEWWQKFFDVDIKQFGLRCAYVFIFWTKKFYPSLGKYGDLWGPIWIPLSMLIILSTCTIFGKSVSNDGSFNVNMVIGYAVGLIVYQILIPGILYLIIRCRSERYVIRMTQLLCIYGYSLIVYLPIGLLLLIPAKINGSTTTMNAILGVVWAVLTVFSVLFIAFTLFGTLKKVFFKKGYWIMTVIFSIIHAGMAVAVLMCVILNSRLTD